MEPNAIDLRKQVVQSEWFRGLSKYEQPSAARAVWQLTNSAIPYFALWAIMVYLLHRGVSLVAILPLIILASGFLVRLFIFFHDCCHGSFFASKLANRIVGYVCGILTFTPYDEWRLAHAGHHATVGDLDRRRGGDIWTLTVDEYRAAPWYVQWRYWLYRNPLILFVLGPLIVFLIVQRFPDRGAQRKERASVVITNLAILAILVLAYFTIGLRTYLLIQLPVISLAGSAGIWLFYVQHQYEGVYWARHDKWDPIRAALKGSSYYKLPKILQWFSGNIGLHHIHHLRSRMPNYNLRRCYDEVPELRDITPLTLRGSLKSLFLNLWDEKEQKLVSFHSLRLTTPFVRSPHPPTTHRTRGAGLNERPIGQA